MGIGNFVSGVFGVGGDGGASDLQRQALAEISKIQFPSVDAMKIYLQKLVQQGKLTPEMANTFAQQKTAYDDMNIDPTGRDAQIQALSRLKDVADQGGMDSIDKARVLDINNAVDTDNRGAQDAIVQNAQERGVGGSGVELAARLQAQQGAATRGANNASQVSADAQARALQALQASGNMGTTVYGEDAQTAEKKAEAQDVINRFNTGNAQNVENANVATRNDAQAKNLAETQRVADTNTNNTNSAEVHNKGLLETDFQNQMAKAGAMAGQYNNLANTALDQAQRKDAFTGEIIGAGGQILAGYNKKASPSDAAAAVVAFKGGRVPGRAPVPGNSPKNDIVNAKLSPDEIVVPRSEAKSPAKAAAFASAAASGAHPDDIESILSALSSLRSKIKKKAA